MPNATCRNGGNAKHPNVRISAQAKRDLAWASKRFNLPQSVILSSAVTRAVENWRKSKCIVLG
jgi:hypothetical protein